MIQHIFNGIKVNTPDDITEQEVINKFCKATKYNPSFGETRKQYFNRLVGLYIIKKYTETIDDEEEETKRINVRNRSQGITTE